MQRGLNGKGSRKLRDYPHNAIRAQHDADEVTRFKNNGLSCVRDDSVIQLCKISIASKALN